MIPPSERIAEIRQRLEEATPGPWLKHGFSDDVVSRDYDDDFEDEYAETVVCNPHRDEDGDLIAHAPGDLRYLLGLVEEQAATIVQLQERVNRMEFGEEATDG